MNLGHSDSQEVVQLQVFEDLHVEEKWDRVLDTHLSVSTIFRVVLELPRELLWCDVFVEVQEVQKILTQEADGDVDRNVH